MAITLEPRRSLRRLVSKNDRMPTLDPVIANPQVGSVGNSRRESTSLNGPADGFRHMLIGYCRTSTADQNPDHQIDALLRHGVDRNNIHIDVASDAKASRPKLDLAAAQGPLLTTHPRRARHRTPEKLA